MPGDLSLLSDIELVRQVQQGEPEAFGALSSRYLGLIRGKARQFEGSAAPEKEDLWQEGFLGLYVAATSYREDSDASFATYAGVCVYNRMASAARKHGNSRNRALNESIPLEDTSEAALGAEPGPEELLELREHFASIQRRIGKTLTPLERRVLALYVSGCRRADIPRETGMTLKAFDNALYRVRSKLRKSE